MELAEIFSRNDESADASTPLASNASTPAAGEDRSYAPDAPMNLLLRFETTSGPRTVIACSVPRQVAAQIKHVMEVVGQHAEYIDRCAPLSVADRVMIKNLH